MSSTVNEFESETSFNNQKIIENSIYNADSPLQFFEDNEPFIPSVNHNGLDSYTQNFKFSSDILMHENGNLSSNSEQIHLDQVALKTNEINTSINKEIINEKMDVDISNNNIDEIQKNSFDNYNVATEVDAQIISNDTNCQSDSVDIINEIPAVESQSISNDPILENIKFENSQNSHDIVNDVIATDVKIQSNDNSNEIEFSDVPVTSDNNLFDIHSYASKKEEFVTPQSSGNDHISSFPNNVDMDSELSETVVTDVEISKVDEITTQSVLVTPKEEVCQTSEEITPMEISKEEKADVNKPEEQEISNVADIDAQVDEKPKSKRGRPSKVKAEISMEEDTPRKRGRPRKIFLSENKKTPVKSERKRGRPRKTLPLSENNDSEIVAETPLKEERKRGRPKKSLTIKPEIHASENDDDWEPKTKIRRESDAENEMMSATKRRLSSRLLKISSNNVEYAEESSELDKSNSDGKRKILSARLIKRESINTDIGESGFGKSARARKLTMLAQALGPLDIEDPGTWPIQLTPEVTLDIIKRGPVQVDGYDFPRNKRRKCFSVNNYLVKNNDGIKFRRNWLVYSKSRDSAFCYPCRIFSNDSSASLASFGCSNWKKIQDRLTVHDNSLKHSECMAKWTEFAIANDCPNSCSSLTTYEALKLAEKVKQFSALKENKLYLLAQQLETELQAMLTQETEEAH